MIWKPRKRVRIDADQIARLERTVARLERLESQKGAALAIAELAFAQGRQSAMAERPEQDECEIHGHEWEPANDTMPVPTCKWCDRVRRDEKPGALHPDRMTILGDDDEALLAALEAEFRDGGRA